MQAARGASLSDPGPVGRPRLPLLLAVAASVLVLDVLTKHLVVDRLSSRDPVELVDGLLTLRLVRNPGAAFGFASGLTVVLTLVAAVVVVVILRAARRLRSTGWAVALGLVLGGALGNLGDRIFRHPAPLRGMVIDFIELPHWPVFNLADSAIVTGGVLLVLLSVRGVQYDGRRAGVVNRADEPPADEA
ncbi:MAG: signal peptidase II [Actinomycetes bacterium]